MLGALHDGTADGADVVFIAVAGGRDRLGGGLAAQGTGEGRLALLLTGGGLGDHAGAVAVFAQQVGEPHAVAVQVAVAGQSQVAGLLAVAVVEDHELGLGRNGAGPDVAFVEGHGDAGPLDHAGVALGPVVQVHDGPAVHVLIENGLHRGLGRATAGADAVDIAVRGLGHVLGADVAALGAGVGPDTGGDAGGSGGDGTAVVAVDTEVAALIDGPTAGAVVEVVHALRDRKIRGLGAVAVAEDHIGGIRRDRVIVDVAFQQGHGLAGPGGHAGVGIGPEVDVGGAPSGGVGQQDGLLSTGGEGDGRDQTQHHHGHQDQTHDPDEFLGVFHCGVPPFFDLFDDPLDHWIQGIGVICRRWRGL